MTFFVHFLPIPLTSTTFWRVLRGGAVAHFVELRILNLMVHSDFDGGWLNGLHDTESSLRVAKLNLSYPACCTSFYVF